MCKIKLTNSELDIKASIYKRITNPLYVILVTLTAIGTYGFMLANPSPSIDWLSYDKYYNGLLFGQGRFTATIVEKLFMLWDCPVWFEPFLGLCFFILGTLILLSVFDGFVKFKSIVPSIVFTCIYISFPLLPEYFIYNGAILTVGGCTVLFSLALYFSIKFTDFFRSFLLPTGLLILVISWYECLVLPYIGAVFAILILIEMNREKYKSKYIIRNGIFFAVILAAAAILEFVVTKIIIKLFSIPQNEFANTKSYWTYGTGSFYRLIRSYIINWVLKVFCYPPFMLLLAAGIIFFVMFIVRIRKTKSFGTVILFLGSLIPVFAMTMFRGGGSEYRTEQGMPFFVAFTAYLISLSSSAFKKPFKRILCAVFAFVMIISCGASNRSYWVNNLRYEEEKNVILTVNNIITEKFDKSKPVVFIGGYNMSDSLMEKITVADDSFTGKIIHKFAKEESVTRMKTYYHLIGCSYINWGIRATFDYDKPEDELYKFCDYLGINFNHCTRAQFDEAIKKYSNIPSYPDQGFIIETDEYIVVNMK